MSALITIEPQRKAAVLHLLKQALYEKSLYEFAKAAWHLVEPDIEFKENWHILAICQHLEAVAEDKIPQLLINVPPGTSKSLFCCVFFPAWIWATKPWKRFLFFSYSETLSLRDSLRTRDIIRSSWYQSLWPVRIKRDRDTVTRFENEEGGWRLVGSISGRGLGEHGDYSICDDPHNVLQAESDADRQTVTRWFEGVFCVRGEVRNAKRVLIMQRLHMLDCSGVALEKGGWDHLCLPMRFEADAEDGTSSHPSATTAKRPTSLGFVDPRTEDGEYLWPEVYTPTKVANLENNMGIYVAAGQLQQRPAPRGGGMFKRDWFPILPAVPPNIKKLVAYVDKAGCLTADTWVDTRRGEVLITDVREGDEVMTRNGWGRVLFSGETKRTYLLSSVLFSDGTWVTGTPDHRIWSERGYWADLGTITGQDAVCDLWQIKSILKKKPLCSKESVTPESRDGGIFLVCAGTRNANATLQIPCTAPFGDPPTVKFPLARISTTRMGTGITMSFQIFNCSPTPSTCESTAKRFQILQNFGGTWIASVLRLFAPTTSTKIQNEEKVNRGSADLQRRADALSGMLCACNAESNFRENLNVSRVIVPTVVNGIGDTDSVKNGHAVPVYDLTVDGSPEFFANGTLVHNSEPGKGTTAETAIVLMAEYEDPNAVLESMKMKYIVLEVIHGMWNADQREAIIKQTTQAWEAQYGFIEWWVEQEPGSGGKESAEHTVANNPGYAFKIEKVTGEKSVRAEPLASQSSVKKISLRQAVWNGYLLNEFEVFPMGKVKDVVDASSGAFNKLWQPGGGVTGVHQIRTGSGRVGDNRAS